MRRLLVILALCLLPVSVWGVSLIGSGVVASSGGDYSDITFWCGFEGTYSSPTYTMGAADCSDGDTTGTTAGTCYINSTAALVGSNGFYGENGWDRVYFSVTSDDIISGSAGRLGMYIRPVTLADNGYIFSLSGDSDFLVCYVDTDELAFTFDGYIVGTTTGVDLATNGTKYFIEISWDSVNDIYEIYVDGVLKMSRTDVDKNAIINITELNIGQQTGTASTTYIDNVMISTDPDRDFYSDGLYDDTSVPSGACDD